MSSAILVRDHVEDNAITPARPRGRQIGQVVAPYRSRVPVNVIATELDHLSGRPEDTERYVGEELGVFQLVDLKCNVAGCQKDMYRKWRENRGRYYYHCNGSSDTHKKRYQSAAKNTFFYRRKLRIDLSYRSLNQYVENSSITKVHGRYTISLPAVGKLTKDVNTLMLCDYVNRNMPFRLGSSPDCDHIQIDESKFGKRKHHRGHRVEGVWVFGMVEAIKVGEEVSKTNGRFTRSLCFVLADFYGWKGYDFMHPPDVLLEDGTYENNEGRYEDGDYYFRQHQVVNHSKSFGTKDQVRYCAEKLLEYLWKKENPSVLEGLNRALKEVVYTSGTVGPIAELNVPQLFTRGENGLCPERQRQHEARLESRRVAWIRRNPNGAENDASSSGSDDEGHSSNSNASEGSKDSDWSGNKDNDMGEWNESGADDLPVQQAEANPEASQDNQRRSVTAASGTRRATRATVASSQAETSSASSGFFP
ncbi:uncharacterized protein EV154DRAFT_586631 [Mucor mucedo]|uniref:uncharacterized protein n=1 Tax=Mucor mucedo TaxID=29922 RepID=UPI00221EFA8F|nr:uncharacterized protein EV154DRAFT_586631 [Mucor mucedo]KAI7863507.1 hypothetical protein EV154DRAFT_586631 [Mucor mucedo]